MTNAADAESSASQTTKSLFKKSQNAIAKIQSDGFSPDGVKRNTRLYSINEATELLDLSDSAIRKAEKEGRLPTPEKGANGRRLGFTLSELHHLRTVFGKTVQRQENEDPVILAVSILKGGVGKTTTAVHLAQHLTLQGYRVLLVDSDPQASTSALLGYIPEKDINDLNGTLYSYYSGRTDSLSSVIRKTYWDGLDLIPANLYLFQSEIEESDLESADTYSQLRDGLNDIKHNYDVIIIDPPPSLGILSLNVICAADALIVPIPAQYPDLASANSYFKILYQTLESLEQSNAVADRDYKFVKILITRFSRGAERAHTTQAHFAELYECVYGSHLLKSIFHHSTQIEDSFSIQRSLFEMDPKLLGGYPASFKKARTVVEAVCAEIEMEIRKTWPSHCEQLTKDGLL